MCGLFGVETSKCSDGMKWAEQDTHMAIAPTDKSSMVCSSGEQAHGRMIRREGTRHQPSYVQAHMSCSLHANVHSPAPT